MRSPLLLLSVPLILCGVVAPAGATRAASATSASHVADAWGSDDDSMLGDAGATSWAARHPIQVALPPSVRVTALRSSTTDVLALTSTGAVYAWGANSYGQLGDGTTTTAEAPTRVAFPPGTVVTDIAAGPVFSLAVTSTGAVYGWGWGGPWIDQNTDSGPQPVPTLFTHAPPAVAVAAGFGTSYILSTAGSVYALGDNIQGSLGTGTNPESTTTPIQLAFPGGATIATITAGDHNGYAINSTGQVFSWGPNPAGGLGDGSNFGSESSVPAAVDLPAQTVITAVSADAYGDHVLALTSTGTVYSWGEDIVGQLGDGTTNATSTPVPVRMPSGVRFSAVSAGGEASLAVTTTGNVYGWGNGYFGQLGTDSKANEPTPTKIAIPDGAKAYGVAASSRTSFAIVTPEPPPTITPSINGLPRVGDLLACAPSRPVPIGTVPTWQWTSDGHTVATTQTYKIAPTGFGRPFTCTLHLDNGYGTSSATSAAVRPIWQTSLINLNKPTLTGRHKAGTTEKVSHGSWSPHPTGWHYQWYAGPTPIKGATSPRLKIPADLTRKSISCQVRVTRHHTNSGLTTTRPVKIIH